MTNLFKDLYKLTNALSLWSCRSFVKYKSDSWLYKERSSGVPTIKKKHEDILQIIKYEIYRQETIELGIYLVADRWKTHGRICVRLRGLILVEAAENDKRSQLEKDHLLIFLLAVKIAL